MIPGTAMRGDGERETVHRLEAFSDIVIGFCIAEMGINLLIPHTVAELPHIVLGTAGFVFSFVLIAIVWWIHHRIFRTFFVLNQLNVALNFAMLGALVLMVYFQQVSLHFIATGQDPGVAVQAWL
ncbi:MAG TPA: TMEM175 family protein, partial [Candidatus Tumulicola sp.]|nr:TMEM175 family protein [Candidatus Tumulicola sp.]